MTPLAVPLRRRRSLRLRLLVAGISLLLSALGCEAALRIAGGYPLFHWTLVRVGQRNGVAAAGAQPLQSPELGRTIDSFLAVSRTRPDLDPRWVGQTPVVVRHPVRPEHAERVRRWPLASLLNYEFNAAIVREDFDTPAKMAARFPEGFPGTVMAFEYPGGSKHPPFRYPPSATLPEGLTTNRFGWRGPELELDKPAATVRIACVGGSTTVGQAGDAFSYPELLQQWLNLWADAQHLGVHFEVINAGRTGFTSMDIAAVVRFEVLPLAVDYVVYLEGANQFWPADLFAFTPPVAIVRDPNGFVDVPLSLFDRLCRVSATCERLRSVFDRAIELPEPSKPAQVLQLPDGLDEQSPTLDGLSAVLNLGQIRSDLEAIQRRVAAAGAQLVLCTFPWLPHDGMRLQAARHRTIFDETNARFWPLTYANVARCAVLENRFFHLWAAASDVPLIDLAARMPRDPDLYLDSMHETQLGIYFKAWAVLERLTEILGPDLQAGRVPRADLVHDAEHPFLRPAVPMPIGDGRDH